MPFSKGELENAKNHSSHGGQKKTTHISVVFFCRFDEPDIVSKAIWSALKEARLAAV